MALDVAFNRHAKPIRIGTPAMMVEWLKAHPEIQVHEVYECEKNIFISREQYLELKGG
jgi:hypothetical protein